MEYLEGENLYEFACKQPPLPVAVAIDYILQACIALAKAHAMKITHRDIKPSNLFLTHQDGLSRVKVLDFGLAKDASPSSMSGNPNTQTDQIIGTLAYMPPEQLRGLKYATPLTDIFALGVCLYFLLTLNEPFPGDEAADIIVNISTRPPVPMRSYRPDLPQGLVDIIERSLSKKPEDRQQSITEFARELVHFAAPNPSRWMTTIARWSQLTGGIEKSAPRATRWMTMIESAAAAGALASERMEEERPTIKLVPSTPPNDPTTIPFQRQAATIPLARPQSPPIQWVPAHAQRQTNSRLVLGATAGIVTLAAIIGISFTQCAPPPSPGLITPAPSTSAESTPKSVDPAPSSMPSAILAPSPPPSIAPSGSTSVPGRPTTTKNNSTSKEGTF